MSTSLQQLPPVSRYYIRRLLQQAMDAGAQHPVDSGITQTNIKTVGISNNQIDQSIEALLDQDEQAEAKLAELEKLALLFQRLSTQGNAFSAQMMSRVENRVAKLLGFELGQVVFQPPQPLSDPLLTPPAPTEEPPTLMGSEYLGALNKISRMSKKFIGAVLTTKTWQSCRPDANCIAHIQVSDQGELYYLGEDFCLTAEQKALLRKWRVEFIRRCSRIVHNFEPMLKAAGILVPSHN